MKSRALLTALFLGALLLTGGLLARATAAAAEAPADTKAGCAHAGSADGAADGAAGGDCCKSCEHCAAGKDCPCCAGDAAACKAAADRIDTLVATMKSATGEARLNAMAALLEELAALRPMAMGRMAGCCGHAGAAHAEHGSGLAAPAAQAASCCSGCGHGAGKPAGR
jgi:hypothetical protein